MAIRYFELSNFIVGFTIYGKDSTVYFRYWLNGSKFCTVFYITVLNPNQGWFELQGGVIQTTSGCIFTFQGVSSKRLYPLKIKGIKINLLAYFFHNCMSV